MRAAGRAVAANQRGTDLRVAFGWFELAGHPGQKPLEYKFHLNANHRIERAGHANVRLERRAAGKDALVRGGDVRVRAQQRSNATIEIPPQRDLLAGSLSVNVDEDDLGGGVLGDLREQLVQPCEKGSSQLDMKTRPRQVG